MLDKTFCLHKNWYGKHYININYNKFKNFLITLKIIVKLILDITS